MPKPFRPTTLQMPPGSATVASSRHAYAEALRSAELELRASQGALNVDDCDINRARYAAALAQYHALQGMFPLVAAGSFDGEA